MEALIALLVLVAVAVLLVSPVLALVALVRSSRMQDEVRGLRAEIEALRRRVDAAGRLAAAERALAEQGAGLPPIPAVPPRPAAAPPSVAGPAVAPPVPPSPRLPVTPAPPAHAVAAGAIPVAPTLPPPRPPRPPAPPAGGAPRPPRPPAADFATNLGPRILVATGALAFVVFLGLFVKYAWDNNWVGPTGRVLSGAVLGLGLLAFGTRIMGKEYRPLGQGLAAAGLAGLYSSAFAAHGVYQLIPRGPAGVLMAAITVCSVLLAERLDARLLATLAWVGGYLTPVLLSTGEDKAIALYLFLLFLDAGALVLDHRKPWPETVPLAMVGTLLLYGGWYAQFFRPERFEVAALGIVLFTALFAFGMARKERSGGLGVVYVLGALGLATLAGGADRPEVLVVLSLALGGAAVRAASSLGRAFALVAAFAVGLPFFVWSVAFYEPEAFGIAAAWLVGASLLLIVPAGGLQEAAAPGAPAAAGTAAFLGAVLVVSGVASIALCRSTDRPPALLAFLAAQAGVALLARLRWSWAGFVGIVAGMLSVFAWMDRFYVTARASDAYLLTVPLGGLFLVALLVRGLVLRRPLAVPDVLAHLVNALFVWTVLFRVLYDGQPRLLGLLSVGLGAVYLAAGLAAAQQRPRDARQVRALLGLAAGFLTVAIPVQLGLHGITLAWAVEGVLLIGLGVKFRSALTRVGGYSVLGLTVLRLFARHLPLHPRPFDPVFNPPFGTWMFVVLALGVAVLMVRGVGEEEGAPDRVLAPLVATTALLLLWGLLTAETADTFAQNARRAATAGDVGAAQQARRAGGLAVSVLWTVFATALLSAGLALRNRPLFYASYALFALTAGKVVFWDLGEFSVPYRMLAFLALGLLLMAGAYLNLRFRERLAPPGAVR